MKKVFNLFAIAFCAIFIMGTGIAALAPQAHAATTGQASAGLSSQTSQLTPAEIATLETSLDGLKEQVMELEAQAALQEKPQSAAQGEASQTIPAGRLSANEMTSLGNALSELSSSLYSLNSEISSNPEIVNGHQTALMLALAGTDNILASITNTIKAAMAPVAVSSSGSPSAVSSGSAIASTNPNGSIADQNTKPAAQGSLSSKPAAGAQTPAAATAASDENPVGQSSAQSSMQSSVRSINWPLAALIIFILALIALWLFWPGKRKNARQIQSSSNDAATGKPAVSSPASILNADINVVAAANTVVTKTSVAATTPVSAVVATNIAANAAAAAINKAAAVGKADVNTDVQIAKAAPESPKVIVARKPAKS